MTFSNIVITGASSGIGAALAKYYARPGIALGLLGRDPARLNAVAGNVRAAGGCSIRLDGVDYEADAEPNLPMI